MTTISKSMKPSLPPAATALITTVIVLTIIAAGGWLVAFGLPTGEAANWWTLIATVLLLSLAVLAFRYIDHRQMSLIKKCIIISVLLHILIAFCFSAVVVTQQIVRMVHSEPPMTPSINLQLAREMQVREQVRQQIQELPVITETPSLVAQQVDSPLHPTAPKIESLGSPNTTLHQLTNSRNPIAPTVPQAAPAPDLITPLLPISPTLTPTIETTPLPTPLADVSRQSTHFAGPVNEQLARATSPLLGEGPGELTAPPASLAQGSSTGGSNNPSGNNKPFTLWDGKIPPPLPEKSPITVAPPPPVAPPSSTPTDLPAQRNFNERQKQIQQNGGTPETEAAVARALVYFSKTQYPDGHWTKITDKTGNRTTDAHDNALTSLALLCYLAAGNTPDTPGPYQETVTRAIDYLIAHEARDGDLRGDGNMYDQGISSLAMAEAAAMTKGKMQAPIKDAAHRAAEFIVAAQNGAGGWRYSPRDLFSDTSVMGWQILALHSASRTGFQIPAETHRKALAYLDSVSTGHQGMLTGYITAVPASTMTAEATFTRMLIGQPLSPDQLNESAQYLLRKLPAAKELNFYYIYYGSLSLMQTQSPAWTQWNNNTSRLLLSLQQPTGPNAGSWTPEDDEEWGTRGGRIYTTALATLSLEVYYRYLPMYAQKK